MSDLQTSTVALSVKQPWAALLAAGLKTIEIRRWPTLRRGRILIHAGRVPDDRPHGWRLVPDDIQPLTQLRGGIIGAAELVACKRYPDPKIFQADQSLHCNQPDWFEEAGLYGFVFTGAEFVAFRKCPGWFRFFTVANSLETSSVQT